MLLSPDLIEVVDLPLIGVKLTRLVARHGDDPALVDPQPEVQLLDGGPPRPGRRNRLPAEPAPAGKVPEVGAGAVGRVLASEDVGRGLETRRRRAEVERTRVTHS